jgi:hypothetical protein
MDPNTGRIYQTENEDASRAAGHIPLEAESVDPLRLMNRHQRRHFAALVRRGYSQEQALMAVRGG